jgi:hypothetical protein
MIKKNSNEVGWWSSNTCTLMFKMFSVQISASRGSTFFFPQLYYLANSLDIGSVIKQPPCPQKIKLGVHRVYFLETVLHGSKHRGSEWT